MNDNTNNVNGEKLALAIQLLKTHVTDASVKPFIAILEAIKLQPDDSSLKEQLYEEFQNLGIYQGAILTYASCIYDIIVDDPFWDHRK